MKILHAFDLDETLVMNDPEFDREYQYNNIEHQKPIQVMQDIFHHEENKCIITNRAPWLQEELVSRYGCDVYCRPYCLTQFEIELVNSSDKEREWFMQDMAIWKTNRINELAKEYDQVVFWEDMLHIFDENYFADNVVPRLPLHLEGVCNEVCQPLGNATMQDGRFPG